MNEKLYELLDKLYTELLNMFNSHTFHMGGDEVNLNCYKTSKEIQEYLSKSGKLMSDQAIMDLWFTFQEKVANLVQKVKKQPMILWSSALTSTNEIQKHLSNKDYIIQFWDEMSSPNFLKLLENDYKVIVSNFDAWYFDCGYASWVSNGSNWCSPYKGINLIFLLHNFLSAFIKLQLVCSLVKFSLSR